MELEQFVDKCKKICLDLGTDTDFVPGSAIYGNAVVWEDDDIMVACCEDSQEMEIVIKPKLHLKNIRNPVVYITEEGEMLRSHGKWTFAENKINKIFAGLD